MFEIWEKPCYNVCVAVATHSFLSVSLKAILWWRIIALMLRLGANVSIKTTVQTIHSCKCSPDTCSDLTLSLLVITCVVPVAWGLVGAVKPLWAGDSLHVGPPWEQQETSACTRVRDSDAGASNLWRKGSLQSHPIMKLYSGHNRPLSTLCHLQPGNYSCLFSLYWVFKICGL